MDDELKQATEATKDWWRMVQAIKSEEGKVGAKAAMAMACLEDLVAMEDPDYRRIMLVTVMQSSGLHDLMQREMDAWAKMN